MNGLKVFGQYKTLLLYRSLCSLSYTAVMKTDSLSIIKKFFLWVVLKNETIQKNVSIRLYRTPKEVNKFKKIYSS